MHDFEPGWDTYKEMPGYAMDSDLTFADVVPSDYAAVVCIGGRAPEYLRNDRRVLEILRELDATARGSSRSATASSSSRRPAWRRGRR